MRRPWISSAACSALLAAVAGPGAGAQLLPDQAKLVLEAHNEWRARHQAEPLRWSPELARYAQSWAELLVRRYPGRLLHSDDGGGAIPEARELGYGDWGENLYWSSALRWSDGSRQARRDLTPAEVVDSWGGEVRWYDFATGACSAPSSEGCGHFTQVVWRESTSVGCGRAFGADSAQVWVCTYDPPGNYEGEYQRNVLPESVDPAGDPGGGEESVGPARVSDLGRSFRLPIEGVPSGTRPTVVPPASLRVGYIGAPNAGS